MSVALFGIRFDAVSQGEAIDRILGWIARPSDPCRYVVTPNVQHAVLFQKHAEFRSAYGDASLTLADGTPIVWASRWLGSPLPERVAGSDLAPALFRAAATSGQALTVFLLGAGPGVAERAARAIESPYPGVRVVGVHSPPLGFQSDARENAAALERIAHASPDLLIVGLGAPKQELWVHRFRHELRAHVALCAGATIDFLAGDKQRAPSWMRDTGLEWLHRVGTEPRRLAGRYASDALKFPPLVVREWRARRESNGRTRER